MQGIAECYTGMAIHIRSTEEDHSGKSREDLGSLGQVGRH